MVVFKERIHYSSRRNHVAAQYVRYGVHAGSPDVAYPQRRVYTVIVDEIQLQDIRRIDQHDYLFENSLSFQRFEIGKQIHFFPAQTEIVAVRHVLCYGRYAGRQIRPLAARTGKHHERDVAVGRERVLQRVGVLVPRNFVDTVLPLVSSGRSRVFALISARNVEFPEIRVDCAFAERLLQRGAEGHRVVGRNLTGTGAAVKQIDGRLRKAAELRSFRKRKRIVLVEQQRRAFAFYVAADFFAVSHEFLFVVVIRPIIYRRALFGYNYLRLCVKKNIDYLLIISTHGKCDCHNDGEDAEHYGSNEPRFF